MRLALVESQIAVRPFSMRLALVESQIAVRRRDERGDPARSAARPAGHGLPGHKASGGAEFFSAWALSQPYKPW